jgi:hypothetical protein
MAGWLWLLLATVLSHAVVPGGLPLERGHGSAFSAATVDVATLPGREPLRIVEAKRDDGSNANPGDSGDPASGFTILLPPRLPTSAPSDSRKAAKQQARAAVRLPHVRATPIS